MVLLLLTGKLQKVPAADTFPAEFEILLRFGSKFLFNSDDFVP